MDISLAASFLSCHFKNIPYPGYHIFIASLRLANCCCVSRFSRSFLGASSIVMAFMVAASDFSTATWDIFNPGSSRIVRTNSISWKASLTHTCVNDPILHRVNYRCAFPVRWYLCWNPCAARRGGRRMTRAYPVAQPSRIRR